MDPLNKKSQSDATLYFTTMSVNGFTVHNTAFLHEKIIKRLKNRCRAMGIDAGDWYIEGLGATGEISIILTFLADFYQSHESWFILLKFLGILVGLKKTVRFLLEIPWRIRSTWYRLVRWQSEDNVSPRLLVWVRAEINIRDSMPASPATLPKSVQQAMHELIQLVPEFEAEISVLVPNMQVEFQLTTKYGSARSTNPAIDIIHYVNQEQYLRNVHSFLMRISQKHFSYKLVFYRSKLTNWLKAKTLKDVSII